MGVRKTDGPVLALCGGIGGAKLVLGLYQTLGPGQLTVIVNTGDDFEHLGLSISPDIDTVLYTLAGVADPERGWGRAQETWNFMATLRDLGGEIWFHLGDRDLAMHVERTCFLRDGKTLSAFVAHVARAFGITAQIMPMSDDRLRTVVETTEGDLPFQRYFVEHRCAPIVRALRFEGAERARPASGLIEAILHPALRAIVICPSNPYLSVDPILAVPGVRAALSRAAAPVVVVSPIIGGKAVKGPTVKIMNELGVGATTQAIVAHYRGLIDGIVIDDADASEGASIDMPVLVTQTLMRDLADRARLACQVVAFAETIACEKLAPVLSPRAEGVTLS
jgi:LPPG:FO 2-phospho-L-lactate transferase